MSEPNTPLPPPPAVTEGDRVCLHCGTHNLPTALVCQQCGDPLSPGIPEGLTCPQCYEINPSGSTYCRLCGARLTIVRDRRIPRRVSRPFWTILGWGPVIGLALLIAFALFLFLPTTTITLVPATQTIQEVIQVRASPDVRAISLNDRQIPARVVSVQVSSSDQLPLQAKKKMATAKATGMVVLANAGDTPVTVPKGTIISNAAGTARFETAEEVTVPGEVFGRAKVTVVALEPGPKGNVDKLTLTKIEGTLGTRLYVRNETPTTGGEERFVTYVTLEDRTQLKEILLAKLKEEAITRLRTLTKEGEFIAVESVRLVSIVEETYDRAVNEEANTLELKLRANFDGTAIDGRQANELATRVLSLRNRTGFQIPAQSVTITPREMIKVEGSAVIFAMSVEGTSVAQIDEARIRRDLAGKSLAEAEAYLSAIPNLAEPPTINVSPGWLGDRLTPFDWRIYIRSLSQRRP